MTIKNRLIISFALMIAIVVFIASILFFQGKIQRDYLMDSVQNYSLMAGIREIQYYLEKSGSACDFYLVLGDSSEKSKFNEFSGLLQEKINDYSLQLNNFKISKAEYIEFSEIADACNILISRWQNAINMYSEGKRERAISMIENNVLSYYDKIKERIKSEYEKKINAYQIAEKESLRMEKINFIISVGLSVLAIILAMMLSVFLFRTITRPLTKLKEGAEKIGNGSFSQRIEISGHNELTVLAEAFNKMAENLKRSETQLIQMDRMASLGQLAGGIAHELNNPLTGVLGQTEMLLEKLPPQDPIRETLEKIGKAAERCRKITKGLSDFSRQKDYTFEYIDVPKLLDNSLDICSSDLIASKINVVKKYGKEVPKAYISQPHIQQVFLNIITNAIHAMKHGGTLTIVTDVVINNYVTVAFKDTGDGISKVNLEKMFTPFFTTKEPGKGTGLGLVISYGIIQKHNGKILVSSDGDKKGATFTLRLPAGGIK